MRAPNLAALRLALVPVQEPVYRQGRSSGGVSSPTWCRGAVRAHVSSSWCCKELGRAWIFVVLDVAPTLEDLARSIGLPRDLARWIQDCERNPRSPYLLDLSSSLGDLCTRRVPGDPAVGLALHGPVSVDRADSRSGAGTGVFTVLVTEPQLPAAASSADQDRGKALRARALPDSQS
uniref:Uncharacterized protein n=1 Tax=Ananas comosus var. bracteatus TaxID=296719 RepID=A0A6V7PZF1_ANACO|nr:unnamed protein product [Ananas comosus var. bracteatus]